MHCPEIFIEKINIMLSNHKIIDTHSHIYLEQFDNDREEAIERAKTANVTAILMPNIDENSVSQMFKVCDKHPGYCFPMAGLHPTDVKNDYKEQLKFVEKQLIDNRVIAIGETGIDLYWDKSTLKEQKIAFDFQIRLAYESNLPIVIHSRNSIEVIFKVLNDLKEKIPKGVFHCFSGSFEIAKRIIAMGMYLGIGGVVTFENSKLQNVLAQISLEHIVVETDSPFLAPVPYRGKRNEPSYLTYVIQQIAEIKNIPVEDVSEKICRNSVGLFSNLIN